MPTIHPSALKTLVEKTLAAAGSEPAEAQVVAEHLVRSNLAGHDSHGVGMLTNYLPGIAAGRLVPNQAAETWLDSGAMIGVDGQRGYGQRVAREAIDMLIERAQAHGIALLGLRRCHHVGRIGTYAEQCLEAGLVSLHFVNVQDHRPLVAAFRGKEGVFGTNPVCIGFPKLGDEPGLLLDMATSQIALGKTRVAYLAGKKVPQGAVIDSAGEFSDDPTVMWEEPFGALTPLADHKGYALAFMCEVLAGVLTGGNTIAPHNERKDGIVNNMLSIAIDPSKLGDGAAMGRELDALQAFVMASAPRGVDPILRPGDPERLTGEARAKGIEFDEGNWQSLVEVAASVGVDWA